MQTKILLAIGGFLILILVLLLVPNLSPGLQLTISPEGSYFSVDGRDDLDASKVIKIGAGKHKVVVFKKDYRHQEFDLEVKPIGTTKKTVELNSKIKDIIELLPYSPTGTEYSFVVNGHYNDYLEPVYQVSYSGESSLNEAKKWLSSRGVDLKKDNISYFEDGD
jgi:hypothetical protein